ncbi:signal-regulatory beta-1-like isoform X3 [Pelobates cultripes]|uniref:Signal-regulatory beta-1-like isoform X3 n=1 Tax=Pelobates cultripes TaxID=61616 RepID=A0AAD1WJE4_PELCU|nr:signal-regulatory beta-1-like isoform X3 [Pelobates cultripes]
MKLGLCVFLYILLLQQPTSGVEVTVESPQTTLIGSSVLLPCTFRINNPPINSNFLAIFWNFGNIELLKYDNKGMTTNSKVSVNEQDFKNGVVSLSLHNVTISDEGTYTCLVIYSPDRQEKTVDLHVKASPVVKITKKALLQNHKNQIQCSITDFYPEKIKVTWLRNGSPLPIPTDMKEPQRNADGTYRVNSSLIITPTQDNLLIECKVEHESQTTPIKDSYTVIYGVPPTVQIFSSEIPEHKERVFVCELKGFYPEPVTVKWRQNGKRIESSGRNADGTFNKESFYRIHFSSQNQSADISCEVEHETLLSPIIKTQHIEYYSDHNKSSRLGLTVVLTIIATLAVICALLWYFVYKKKYFKRFVVSPIYRPEMWGEDRKITLYCMAFNCPKEVQVTWIVEDHDEQSNKKSYGGTVDEEKNLLSRDYTIKTDHSRVSGMHNVITAVIMTANLSDEKKKDIVCIFNCDGQTKWQTIVWNPMLLKPQIFHETPIKLSLCDSGDVLCSVNLMNFSPKDIRITWSSGVGHYQDLKTFKEIVTKNPQNMFDAESECRISVKLFNEPGFKVRVTWKHESMDNSETKEVSAADFPWRPQIGDIIIPDLIHSAEAKLQCTISGNFTDNLDVKWFRREPGQQELYLVSPSEKYKLPVMDVTRQEDRTYTCTASLIVTVSGRTDHGAEFICRVGHPSMERPLEKRTGELNVRGIHVFDVFFEYAQSHDLLTADVRVFPKQNIEVTWSRSKSEKSYETYPDSELINKYADIGGGINQLISQYKAKKSIQDHIKYFKVSVKLESMESPVEKIIVRKKGDYSIIDKAGEGLLPKSSIMECNGPPGCSDPPETTEKGEFVISEIRLSVIDPNFVNTFAARKDECHISSLK